MGGKKRAAQKPQATEAPTLCSREECISAGDETAWATCRAGVGICTSRAFLAVDEGQEASVYRKNRGSW